MTEFRCLAVDARGKKGWQRIDAPSEQACVQSLMASGLIPLQVNSGVPTLSERLNQPINISFGTGLNEQALILSQLALLVRSGLPVDHSLDLLRDQAGKARQKKLLAKILADVKEGSGLAKALESQKIFPDYVTGVVRAAEKGGNLGEALTSLSERMIKATETRSKLVTALTYPIAVLIATIAALIIVLTSVVPQFEPIFAGQEDQLPGLTIFVLNLSHLVQQYGGFVLGGGLLFMLVTWLFLRSEAGQKTLSNAAPYVPGMKLRNQYLAAQFSGLLSTLLNGGLTVVRALPLARKTLGSRRWQRELEIVESKIREGSRLSYALEATSVFPNTASRLIEVGERTGKLAETCGHAAKIMGDTASARIERIVSLVNPIAIILLGGLVALLVAGVMLGIFALGDFAG